VLGLRVERISIVENERSGRRTVILWPEGFGPYDDEDYALMEKHLAALYGGTKAVEILTGRPPDPNDPNLNLLDVGSDADHQNDLIHRLAAEEDGQLEVSGRALELAERILHDNWSKRAQSRRPASPPRRVDRRSVRGYPGHGGRQAIARSLKVLGVVVPHFDGRFSVAQESETTEPRPSASLAMDA
jgi:hypothetical protein